MPSISWRPRQQWLSLQQQPHRPRQKGTRLSKVGISRSQLQVSYASTFPTGFTII